MNVFNKFFFPFAFSAVLIFASLGGYEGLSSSEKALIGGLGATVAILAFLLLLMRK